MADDFALPGSTATPLKGAAGAGAGRGDGPVISSGQTLSGDTMNALNLTGTLSGAQAQAALAGGRETPYGHHPGAGSLGGTQQLGFTGTLGAGGLQALGFGGDDEPHKVMEPDTAAGTGVPLHATAAVHHLKDKEAGLLYAVEAQWILSVLGDASDKLFLASFLTPAILSDPILNSTKDRNPIIVHLDDLFEAQDTYVSLLNAREHAAAGVGQWTDAHRQQLQQAEEILADSTRVAMRLLKSNASLISRLRELSVGTRPAPVLEFINAFYRLRNLFAAKLRQTLEKENEDEQQLAALNAQNETDAARLALKQKKLSESAAAHAKLVTEKLDKIDRLRVDYEKEKAKMEDRRAKLLADMADDAKKRERDFVAREADRVRTVNEETAALDAAVSQNFSSELKNHDRRFHHTSAVRDRIAKYDADMTRKHDETLKMKAEYEAEIAEMQRLQTHFDAVDAEDAAVAAEQALVRLRRNRQLEGDRRRHHAAVWVQKLYRGFWIKEKEKARRARIRAKLEAKLKRDVFGNILPGQTIGKKKKKK